MLEPRGGRAARPLLIAGGVAALASLVVVLAVVLLRGQDNAPCCAGTEPPADSDFGGSSTPTPAPGYGASLVSPVPPASSDTYTWRITGRKPGPGQEISHGLIYGCWTEDDIEDVSATGANGPIPSGDIEIEPSGTPPGTVKIDELQDS